MKKIVLGVILMVNALPGFTQMLEAGDGVVELGLGFPNFQPSTFSGISFHTGFDTDQGESRSIGQIIFKGEYMLADNMGVTSSFNYGYFYNRDVATFQEFDSETNQWIDRSYYYESRVHKIRFAVGINLHVLQTNRVDSWFGVQAGTKKAWGNLNTNDPDNTMFSVFVFPYAFRVHYGLRMFFKEYLAAYMELGIGGPIVNMGMTYKF
jgi:hypothetical protein